jgi:hypothetical protein
MSGAKLRRKTAVKKLSTPSVHTESVDEPLNLKINTERLQRFLEEKSGKKQRKKPR